MEHSFHNRIKNLHPLLSHTQRGRGTADIASHAVRVGPQVLLLHRALPLQEALGVFTADSVNVADLASEPNTIALVCTLQQLRTERGRDELGTL